MSGRDRLSNHRLVLPSTRPRILQSAVTPRYPIGTSAPFIWLASLDTRKIRVCAMDSGLTHFDGSASGMLLRFAGVSMVVGRTPLTVTFDPVSSSERARIRATRPDFDTM